MDRADHNARKLLIMKARSALLALAAAFAASVAFAQETHDQAAAKADSDAQGSQNGGHFVDVCFDGLHRGKVIVPNSGAIVDDDLETTAKACRIDGGHRATLPRSPIVPAGSDANA